MMINIHVDIWQKPTQPCKEIIFQLKINTFYKITKKKSNHHTPRTFDLGVTDPQNYEI